MRRVVRGFWGPRQEPAEALAERWSATLTRFARLLPTPGEPEADPRWTWRTAPASGPSRPLRPDGASLLEALRTAQAADDWSAGNGTSLRLVADGPPPGWKVEIAALAGGTPEFLLQSLVATIVSPDDERLPDADLLTAVAEAWHPDHGDVGDRAVTAALKKEAGLRIGTPSVGWVAFLSPGRAARVPADWPAPRKEIPGVGVLLDIAAPGDTAEVVRAYDLLKKAGVLDPLPHPMTGPTL
ncbi:hypothetical protein [Streptomyces sp. Tu 3180]|uniref:Imm52 family immunity protein n=1 Tax=Streptomyces sp. Tu 3180 TaxID=2682611 RepID=UPI00135BF1CD|nr:hypothetical protein [Streptomyces sp. Tu 3180]KAF3467255.1 hypothetical protein GL259_25105 [Streptomyces sp. Tu 3180]